MLNNETLWAELTLRRLEGVPRSQRKSRKEAQEDEGALKQQECRPNSLPFITFFPGPPVILLIAP